MNHHVSGAAAAALLEDSALANPRRFAGFVLYSDGRGLDEEPMLEAVLQRLSGAGATPEVDPATAQRMQNRGMVGVFRRTRERVPLTLSIGGARLTITFHPGSSEPNDWSRFADDASWPEASEALAQGRAHVAIHDSVERNEGDLDSAFDGALAVTLAADAVAGLRRPLAVLWHPACHALSATDFAKAMRALARHRAPLRLWLALRRIESRSGTFVRSEGLAPLIGREIEAAPSPFGALATERMVLETASYLIDKGGRLVHGQLIEGPRESRIRVERTGDQPVWRLSPVG